MPRHAMPVAAHLWLRDADGRLLFMRRANTGYADGCWSVPAGHVEPGETIVEACIREAAEEIGVELSPADLRFGLLQQKLDFDGEERMDVFFTASLPHGAEPCVKEPERCDAIAWHRPDDPPLPLVGYVQAALAHVATAPCGALAFYGYGDAQAPRRPR